MVHSVSHLLAHCPDDAHLVSPRMVASSSFPNCWTYNFISVQVYRSRVNVSVSDVENDVRILDFRF